jgi:two-component system, NarL family, nitrate/nitrite response regulator NarL
VLRVPPQAAPSNGAVVKISPTEFGQGWLAVMSSPTIPTYDPTQQIRVLIAERDRMASQLLAESLEHNSRFQVVAAPAASELLSVVTIRKPDVAVISANLASAEKMGLQIARALTAHHPGIRIVILLDVPARESVIAAFRSGARGVFCRTEPMSEFGTCVERVSRGEIWARRTETDYLLDALRSSPSCDTIGSDKVSMLSKREIEVAELAVKGQTNKEIAAQLRLSEHTIKNYLFRIFEKLGVSNRMELLFLLSAHNKDAAHPAVELDTAGPTNSMEARFTAAEEGSATAQFVVGEAHLDGRGVEKNEPCAYYWLRMAEENSSELWKHSRRLIQNLKDKISVENIEALERRLMTEMLSGHRLASLRKQDGEAIVRGHQFVNSSLKAGRLVDTATQAVERPGDEVLVPLAQLPLRNSVINYHEVQFYSDETFLLERFARFIVNALKAGCVAIVVATKSHRHSLLERLKADGLDVAAVIKQGRYRQFDAADMLSTLMLSDLPDPVRFSEVVGGLIEAASKAARGGLPRVVACGECAPLLWAKGRAEAAIRLEQLFDEVGKTYEMPILCGYPLRGFRCEKDSHVFQRICAVHSGVHSS